MLGPVAILHEPSALTGLRPFSVSMLYAGYNPDYKFPFYCFGREAPCIGANDGTAQSSLKYDYKDNIPVEDPAVLVLRKTMDSTALGGE